MHNYTIYLTINTENKEKEFRLNAKSSSIFTNYRYDKLELPENQKIAWGVNAKQGADLLSVAILETVYNLDFAMEHYQTFSKYLKNINQSEETQFTSQDIDKWLKEHIPNFQNIVITLNSGKNIEFHNHQDLQDWLIKSKNEYIKLLTSNQQIRNNIESKFSEINRNWININDASITCDNSLLNRLGTTISEYLNQINFIDLEDDRILEVKKVYEKEPEIACYMLIYFLNFMTNINPLNNQALKGFFKSLQYENGIKSNIDNEKTQLKSVKEDYSTNQNELIKLLNKYTKEVENNDTTLKNKLDEFEEKYSNFISNSKTDYENVKNFYDTELQLKAPSLYWKKRETQHLKKSIYFAIGLGSVGLLLAVFLLYMVNSHEYLTWSNSATTVIVATGGIWALKMLNKLFMSNYHLYMNAQERFTMINTYLSMISKSNLDNEKDKQYILDALFKHSSDGIINDTDFSLPINDLIKALKK
jgi:hypothetical protein